MEIRWYVVLFAVALGLALVGFSDLWSDSPGGAIAETVVVSAPSETPPSQETIPTPEIISVEDALETAPVAEDAAESDGVATLDGRPISRDDFEEAKASILSQYAKTYAQFGLSISSMLIGAEGRLMELSIEAEALHQLVGASIIEAEAEAHDLMPTDEAVEAELESQIDQILAMQGWTQDQLVSYLAGQGTSYEAFLENGRSSLAWELMLEAVVDEVTGTIELTDGELQTYFAEHIADYSSVEEIHASRLFFGTSSTDLKAYLDEHEADFQVDGQTPPIEEMQDQLVAAIRAEAHEVHESLDEGASFTEVAYALSTGLDNGDLGWFSRGLFGDGFDQAAFALEIGEISDVVETEHGFYIIRLEERQDAYMPPFDEVIEQVRSDLTSQARTERAQMWMETSYSEAELEIHLPLVDAIWTQQEDLDGTIEKLGLLIEAGLPDEPYLGYILGTMLQMRIDEAIEEKAQLESNTDQTPEQAAQIAELENQIAEYAQQAAVGYRLSLEADSEDPTIQTRLNELQEWL